jgi:plastocyanin
MNKKDIRINEDNIKINDSVKTEVIRRVIIPHNFVNKRLEVNYFIPRFKKIRKGERVEWFNDDSSDHHLKFYAISHGDINYLFDLGPIKRGESVSKIFNFDMIRIDYICTLHNNEVGTIIIYQKPEDEMTNTENFRFLSEIFDIKPPAPLNHLRSQ